MSKVSLANKKVAVSLAREEKTALASQMNMDKLVIKSKSKLGDTCNRGAIILGKEKENEMSKKKLKMQDERTDKLLEQQKVRNNKKDEKDKAAALQVHNSLLKQIDTSKSNTSANCLPNDNV